MKIDRPGQHLDHMLRGTRWHHAQLSTMADMKANMLLTMSAVIITLATPHVFQAGEGAPWPFLVLIIFSLVTACLAAYAVMPKLMLSQKDQPPVEIGSPQFNLLFFGDFVHLPYPQFESAMEEMMNDHNRVYQAQVKEIYLLGIYLAQKKYRILRLGYISFIAGLITSFVFMLLGVALR